MNSKSTENQGGIKSLGCETRSNSITTLCTTHNTLGLFFLHTEGDLGREPSPVAHKKPVVLPIIRCCNGLWPRRNTREKGEVACSASINHVQAAVGSNPKPAPSLQSKDNNMMTGRRKPLHRRSPRSLSHMQQVTQAVHKASIPRKFQNEQETWTDFSCTFEISSGIQCNNTWQTGLLRSSRTQLDKQCACFHGCGCCLTRAQNNSPARKILCALIDNRAFK